MKRHCARHPSPKGPQVLRPEVCPPPRRPARCIHVRALANREGGAGAPETEDTPLPHAAAEVAQPLAALRPPATGRGQVPRSGG